MLRQSQGADPALPQESVPQEAVPQVAAGAGPDLAAKVRFLCDRGSYRDGVDEVELRETHMSFIFLAGDRVYKLKKPVRFPYLDFSTLARRGAACRAEDRLNRRLAPDVYLGVVPLTCDGGEFAIGGAGDVVDYLVAMRRLPDHATLDDACATARRHRANSTSSPQRSGASTPMRRGGCSLESRTSPPA